MDFYGKFHCVNALANGYPKFRISTRKRLSGSVNPVKYEVIEYNEHIQYNNGVILIMQPGWYTFTAQIQGPHNDDDNITINLWILVDNTYKSHARRFVS